MDYLRQKNLNLQPHPAKPPDLNPIKHFGDLLIGSALRRQNGRPLCLANLLNAIKLASNQQNKQFNCIHAKKDTSSYCGLCRSNEILNPKWSALKRF